MDTKLIKQKILDLAIRGKLVPQNPADEPASVLLERIKAEKAQLIKEGKIKKEKPLAPIEEVPFEIPESWEWCRLTDYVQGVSDGDHQAPPQSQEGIPFLVISDVNKGYISFEKARFVPEDYYKSIAASRRAKRGDVLFTVTGSYGIVIPVETDESFCFQRHIGLIKTIDSNEWLTYVLKSQYVQRYCDEVSTGTAQKTVSLSGLRELVIPIPSTQEQKRIVTEIDRWFKWIDELEKNQQDLHTAIQQAKSKILDLAIHGKLVPQLKSSNSILYNVIIKKKEKEFLEGKIKKKDIVIKSIDINEMPYMPPMNWTPFRISDIALMYTGNSINESEKNSKYSGVKGTDYIGTKDISFEHDINYSNGIAIPEEFISSFRRAPKGAILLCIEGGSAGKKIAILDKEVCFGNKLCCFIPYDDYSEYLYYYFQTSVFQDQFRINRSGLIGGVSLNLLKDFIVVLPPLEELKEIVFSIKALFHQLDKIEESLN